MEKAHVVIVGAGPAGLVAGLSLAQQGVRSIILERDREITQDPRGVYLAGDAIRILWSLGLGKEMSTIGHELQAVHFHKSSFANTPFHSLDLSGDSLQQSVPTGVLQVQPKLERAIRDRIEATELCELRAGCEVSGIKRKSDCVEIAYDNPEGEQKQLRAAWLVGADGKRGIVRKRFLEPEADIRQVHSAYRYEGTWVAANLRITLPTPETHPELPVWKVGLTPAQVYDLFWPKGWHFCSPPGKPVATGRFGPYNDRLWRHEFRQDEWDEEIMDAEELMWQNLTPMITREHDSSGKSLGGKMTFPRDCIEILRCRPFTFTHKVVNRWFNKQVVLIGDAAHVFPPFGGQGIASGIRDAHQLGWRIALLGKQPNVAPARVERVLKAWAAERTHSVADAAAFTRTNGMLCNERVPPLFYVMQSIEWVKQHLFGWKKPFDPQAVIERRGYQGVSGGFFLADRGGGSKLPQIFLDSIEERNLLSDNILTQGATPFHLIVLAQEPNSVGISQKTLEEMLSDCQVPDAVLSPASFAIVSTKACEPDGLGSATAPTLHKYTPTPVEQLSATQARSGYDMAAFETRLGDRTRYIIARSDFFVFALAKDVTELRACFSGLTSMCS